MAQQLTDSCCAPGTLATCCEPADKAACCGMSAGDSCGCSAGEPKVRGIREIVRNEYAAAARAVATDATASCAPVSTTDAAGAQVFGASLYDATGTEGATSSAVGASLGCGVPTAVADPVEGETVLDLGSGAGADVLISARRVGPTGTAIGLDMTDEPLPA
jgi:hypothetical protein